MDPHEHQSAMHQPAKRPVWRIVIGILLLVLGALALLGILASLGSGTFESPENSGEAVGTFLGAFCCIGVPLIVGFLLLALPPKR